MSNKPISRRRLLAASAFLAVAPNIVTRPARAQWWPFMQGATVGASYTTGGVHFDGATDLELASLTATDSPFLTASYWYQLPLMGSWNNSAGTWISDPPGPPAVLLDGGVTGPAVYIKDETDVSNFINFSDPNVETTAVWHNVLMSVDVNHASGARPHFLYVDDVDVLLDGTTGGIAFTLLPNGKGFSICGDTFGNFSTADLADFWWGCGQFIDFSVTGNRRKFISAGLAPVDLGASGATPTGTPPTFFLRRDPMAAAATFATDLSGNSNTFTITGALTSVAGPP